MDSEDQSNLGSNAEQALLWELDEEWSVDSEDQWSLDSIAEEAAW